MRPTCCRHLLRRAASRVERRRCGPNNFRVDASIVLQTELREHREDAQLIDEVRWVEDVQSIGICAIPLDK